MEKRQDSSDTPPIKIISEFKPIEVGYRLNSPNVSAHIDLYDFEYKYQETLENFFSSEPGSILEHSYASKIATLNLIKNSSKILHSGKDKELWSRRFTEHSVAFYDGIDRDLAEGILKNMIDEISSNKEYSNSQSNLLNKASNTALESLSVDFKFDTSEFNTRLKAMNPVIEKHTRDLENKEFSPVEIRSIVTDIISDYGKFNNEWLEWKCISEDDTQTFRVDRFEKNIVYPDLRGNLPKEELVSLLYHEIGVHVLRYIEGLKADAKLASGLPGYLEFEEGLGIYVEYIISGNLPAKVLDRYVDIHLVTKEDPMSRLELIEFNKMRMKNRLDKSVLSAEEIDSIKVHVNRLFRGGDGLMYGNEPTNAVFTKDSMYLTGFMQVKEYFEKEIAKGKRFEDIYTYIMQGKFNPLIESHEAYLDNVVKSESSDLWERFLEARDSSSTEISSGSKLAKINAERASKKFLETGSPLWEQRVNQSYIELYGSVDPTIASSLIVNELESFNLDLLNDSETKLIEKVMTRIEIPSIDSSHTVIENIDYKRTKLCDYHPTIEYLVNQLEDKQYRAGEIRSLVQIVFNYLEEDDSRWSKWSVDDEPGVEFLIDYRKKVVSISEEHPNLGKNDVGSFLIRTIGVDILRSMHHQELYDDDQLELEGHTQFSLGLKAYMDQIYTGKLSSEISEKYTDLSLLLDDKFLTREELIEYSLIRARNKLRRTLTNDDIIKTTEHINKYFLGESKLATPEELLHFSGYLKVKRYFEDELNKGSEFGEILDFVMSAKFDPTILVHNLEILKQANS